MLEPFVGTFMFHPAALEYSGNTCSNACAYCFANINKERRASKLPSAINQINRFNDEPTSFPAILLRCGLPVCISNRSDPFAKSNTTDTLALFAHISKIPNGIFIQTKGGPGVWEAERMLDGRKNVVWYITLTTIHDDISRRIEPGAPRPSERMAMAQTLAAAGYLVIIAVNPCQREWMSPEDFDALMGWMRDCGIHHVCLEILNISRLMKKNMTTRERAALGDAVIDSANSRPEFIYTRERTEQLVAGGFAVAKKGMPYASRFFDDVRAVIGPTLPVYQDFVNHCFSKLPGTGHVDATFNDFWQTLFSHPLFGVRFEKNYLRQYLLRASMRVWKETRHLGSFKQLSALLWNDRRLNNGIQRHCLFKKVGCDADGNAILRFTGRMWEERG